MGISIPQLLIVLAILILLFGTKRLRNIGGDLGSAVKGFRKAMGGSEEPEQADKKTSPEKLEGQDAQFEQNDTAETKKDKHQS